MYKIFSFCLIICFALSCKMETERANVVNANTISELPKNNKSIDTNTFETISFPSKDGLLITADVYKVKGIPVSVLLCHQAGFSRGEYKDTALVLNDLGYSVMAIDQRSGNEANAIVNETAKLAAEQKLSSNYLDAKQDIEAAVNFVYKENNNKPILLVGSSYSASLALLIGVSNEKIKAVAAFSPGEYFKGINIQESIMDYDKPIFVTASNRETADLSKLVSEINSKILTHYKSTEKGIHGSRALWDSTEGTKGYWEAFKLFLNKI